MNLNVFMKSFSMALPFPISTLAASKVFLSSSSSNGPSRALASPSRALVPMAPPMTKLRVKPRCPHRRHVLVFSLYTWPTMDVLLKDRNAPMATLDLLWTFSWKTKMLLRSPPTYYGSFPKRWKRSYGHTRITMDVLLKDENALTVTLDLLWMFSWKMKTLLRSHLTSYGRSPERRKRSYGHLRSIMDVLLKDENAPSVTSDLLWMFSWRTEMLVESPLTF